MSATRGRGGFRGGGRGRGDIGGRPRCSYCGRLGHRVEKCWDIVGRPQIAHVTMESHTTASTSEDLTFTVSQADYERLQQLKVTDSTTMATQAISSGTSTLIASRDSSWIIDSDASSNMSGT